MGGGDMKKILLVILMGLVLLTAVAAVERSGRQYDVIRERARECSIIKEIDADDVNFPLNAQKRCTELNPRNIFCRNDCRRSALNKYDIERKKKLKMLQSSLGEAEKDKCKLLDDS